MKMTKLAFLFAAMLALVCNCGAVKAQSIYIEITASGTPTTYGPYTGPSVELPGTIPGMTEIASDVTMIRIYSAQDIGHITLTANRPASNPLAILVANPNQEVFPESPDSLIASSGPHAAIGAVNWDGITCSSDCKSAVRVAAGVSGAITGPVDVGQVFRLQAGGAISGDVLASNQDGVPSAWPAIGAILAASISGDIEATSGTVDDIWATSTSQGGITGNVLAPAGEIRSILSGWEIGQQTSTTPVRIEAKTGIGSIQAKAINADIKADANNGTGTVRLLKATKDSSGGNFKGSLQSKGLGVAGQPAGSSGISLTGHATAPILIDGDVASGSNLSAATFREPITIVGSLSSSISTTGDAVGTNAEIEELTIGSIVFPPSGIAPTISATTSNGAVGKYIKMLRVIDEIVPGNGGMCSIRCARLDTIEVAGGAAFSVAASSNLSTVHAVTGLPLTTPTAVGDVKIGGPFTGVLYASSLDSFECDDFAGAIYLSSPYGPPPSNEFPRGRIALGRNVLGHIWFMTSEGLQEHVIANCRGEDGGDFAGVITVTQTSGPNIVMNSVVAGVPNVHSSLLGGGSIAHWPYQLYPAECYPSGFLLGGEQTDLTAGEFTAQTEAVQVRFTGPIYTTLSGQNPVQLEFIRYINGMTFNTRIDDGDFVATIPSSPSAGSDREIRLVGDGSYLFAPGLYRVSLNPDVSDPVLCDGIVDASGDPLARPVAPFVYYFWLANDCDPCICAGLCTVADYDGNGGIDGGDLAAFFTDFEAGLADVDMNGGVDGGDIATFFCWFEQGGC